MQLHYTDSDETGPIKDGRPFVVLHGLFGSADNWRSHSKLWQESRRVITIDLRNHGRSEHVEGMSYDAMAGDVIALLDSLNIERFDILGHSMGGKVAMTIAREYPDRVAHLVVADIAPVEYAHGHSAIFNALRKVEAAEPTTRKDAIALMEDDVDSAPTRQFLATNLVRDDEGVMRWRLAVDNIINGYDEIAKAPGGDKPYTGPALVIRGDLSHYVLEKYYPDVLAVLPNAKIETIEGTGHWLHAEAPDTFRKLAENFLGDR